MFTPSSVLGMWLRSLFGLVMIGAAIYLLTEWYNHRTTEIVEQVVQPQKEDLNGDGLSRPIITEKRTVVPWQFGMNRVTAFLLGGIILISWSIGGGWCLSTRLFRRPGKDEPHAEPSTQTEMIPLPDGTLLCVEFLGSPDADPVVLTHGWGLDKDEWCYAKKLLNSKFRVITWDLPGLGKSDRPADRDWSLEKLAAILDVVISKSDRQPVALIGHSIGVMIALTYCKIFPTALGTRVRALVLAHGTYTNPVKTTKNAALHTALQKPVIEPLCHLMIWLSPLVRVMNWLSYLNGSAHRSTDRNSFSGKETRGQLDFLSRYTCRAAPDVIASGMLAMLRYDVTDSLRNITIPTLVVAGDKDEICPAEASRFISSSIPHAQLTTLTDSRHCGLFEYPQEFNNAVYKFLRSNDSPTAPSAAGNMTEVHGK